MQLPNSIDEVLDRLSELIDQTIKEKNPLGLFAALYQKVTIKVKEGIVSGRFEDGPRMEKLDVIFANRYLEAYHQYTSGQEPTLSWKAAFESAQRTDLLLLQHLFVGMNAHINLDLGIAAATVCPGVGIEKIKNDFMEINNLLFELIEDVQENISKVSPFLGLMDLLAKDRDEQFAKFSMKAARDHAWLVAQRMAFVDTLGRREAIYSTDLYVVELNKMILKPGRFFQFCSWIIRLAESKDAVKNIKALS